MKNIEVEVRGPLNESELKEAKAFFDKNAKFIKEKDRLTLLYFRGDKIPKDVSEYHGEKVDLRLRVTNKKAEMIIKYGSWSGSDSRKEISLQIDLNKFEEAIEFLKNLGWHVCVAYSTKTHVYEYKEIEFALVDILNLKDNYFEAEIMAHENEDINKIKQDLIKLCKEIGLREYKGNEFEKQCNDINYICPLDFNKDSFSDLKKKFKEFL
ncbi:CYTH domain-containing protein [Candidatus Woesearchaeota archaeon]|nr:CYTH domain-containing protein [Candidatus Woesearchaeota archaeon]